MRSPERFLAVALAGLLLSSTAPSATPEGGARSGFPEILPEVEPVATVDLKRAREEAGPPLDFDLLAGGRLAVLFADPFEVAIFDRSGRHESSLPSPPDIDPLSILAVRLAPLPGGGLVLADQHLDRFLFYDADLDFARAVPFGFDADLVGGLLVHPSGDLFLAAYSRQKGKVVHRFDARGRYADSYVESRAGAFPGETPDSGEIALDPSDGTLWLTRYNAYEILHLKPDGTLLHRITRDLWGTPGGARIAVAGGTVIHSYQKGNGRVRVDLFRRDGTLIDADLPRHSPLALLKRAGGGFLLKRAPGESARIEIYREVR